MDEEGPQQRILQQVPKVNRHTMVWGYVERVALEMIAQKAINEQTKLFYKKDGRRHLLITYGSLEMNAYIGAEACFAEVVTSVLYTVLPPKSGYKKCLIYNHGRNILSYRNLGVNGSEGEQNDLNDSVQIPGTQTLFVFNYPSEATDTVMMVIREHERQVKDRALASKREKRRQQAQLTLNSF
jgi:hypothetical protein